MEIDSSPIGMPTGIGRHAFDFTFPQTLQFPSMEVTEPFPGLMTMEHNLEHDHFRRRGDNLDTSMDLDNSMGDSPVSNLAADISYNMGLQTPQKRQSLNEFSSEGSSLGSPVHSNPMVEDEMDQDDSPLPHKRAFLSKLRAGRVLNNNSSPFGDSPNGSIGDSSSPLYHKKMDNNQNRVKGEKRKEPKNEPSIGPKNESSPTSRLFSRDIPRSAMRQIAKPRLPLLGTTSTLTPPLFARTATAPVMNLEAMFNNTSPDSSLEKKGLRRQSMFASPSPSKFGASPCDLMQNGSPIRMPCLQSPIKRQGKIRRTVSMFNKEEDIQREEREEEKGLQAHAKASSPFPNPSLPPGEEHVVPCFQFQDDPIRRVSKRTLCDVLDGKYKDRFVDTFIVDCRFDWEFEGGHIDGAINCKGHSDLENFFLHPPKQGRTLIILHCEFSKHRAPGMALHLRSRDRQVNIHRYPELTYPDIYVLHGGYKAFYDDHHIRCEPQAYIAMGTRARQAEKEMERFDRSAKLARTNSYTFGSASSKLDDGNGAFLNLAKRAGNGRSGNGLTRGLSDLSVLRGRRKPSIF